MNDQCLLNCKEAWLTLIDTPRCVELMRHVSVSLIATQFIMWSQMSLLVSMNARDWSETPAEVFHLFGKKHLTLDFPCNFATFVCDNTMPKAVPVCFLQLLTLIF